MIKRPGHILILAFGLTACAGPPARGQTTTANPGRGISPNIYEIAPEQIMQAQEAASFIEVSGTARVSVPTDMAQVSFAMETRGSTAEEAATSNAAAMERVLQALRGGALPGLELATFGYSLQPQYATDPARVRTIVAYAANNNVGATITDVDAVGRLIDLAIRAGANQVASITFSASDTEPARAEALAEAVNNARAQAQVMARALGYSLGAPLEIRGGAQRPGPRPMAFAELSARAMQAAPTPIEAGDQTVDANVTIRFALGSALTGR
ncbi:MAG: SIMPL domain-containing protein [Gemmatimonadota bacterium]|nr:SIMPL domain-containing protein [Gemmatimonadota bacterium]